MSLPRHRHPRLADTLLLGFSAVFILAGLACDAAPDAVPPAPTAAAADLVVAREAIRAHIEGQDLSEQEVREWITFAEDIKKNVKQDLSLTARLERTFRNPWVAFGFLAQATFMMRFVLQIIASERKKRSYVPVAFWYLSLAGGLMLFVYALQRRDPVFVFGQGLGIFIYARNLSLIYRRRDNLQDKRAERQRRANGPDTASDE